MTSTHPTIKKRQEFNTEPKREREKERERERETDRQTKKEIERETQRDRECELKGEAAVQTTLIHSKALLPGDLAGVRD